MSLMTPDSAGMKTGLAAEFGLIGVANDPCFSGNEDLNSLVVGILNRVANDP